MSHLTFFSLSFLNSALLLIGVFGGGTTQPRIFFMARSCHQRQFEFPLGFLGRSPGFPGNSECRMDIRFLPIGMNLYFP